MNLLTTSDAAEKLGVTRRRVLALIADGRLPAQKVGRDYVIQEENLKLVKDRKPGRPRSKNTKPEGKRKKTKR